jgi:hypothetical protein
MPGQDLSDGESAEAYQERIGKLLEAIPEVTEEEEIAAAAARRLE